LCLGSGYNDLWSQRGKCHVDDLEVGQATEVLPALSTVKSSKQPARFGGNDHPLVVIGAHRD
jgi:hypothetical protein